MISIESIKRKLWHFLPFDLEAKREISRDRAKARLSAGEDGVHLKETVQWILKAQDASGDDGVSRGYSTTSISAVGYRGWEPSYPETTGYIIPTMMCIHQMYGDEEYLERACRMADWETGIQLESGAVKGGVVTSKPSPAVFNTGQVIFGWLDAFSKAGEKKYLDSALKAGEFLVSVQDEQGSWDRGDSNFAIKGATTYNTRVAWALVELGIKTGNGRFIESGQRFIELALTRQNENGWFSQNCLNDPERPLLHTIIYATRGVLESGICLKEMKYVDAGLKTLDALIKCQRSDGGIPGRLAADWSSQADWDCVTGDAQAAIALLRAYAVDGNKRYKESARKLIEFVKRSQNLVHPNPGIRGGVKGSFPFNGPYGQYEMLNWAAKFFCDALIMINDEKLAEKGIKG